MLTLTVTAILTATGAVSLDDPAPQTAAPPCQAYPQGANDACKACMDAACDEMKKDWPLCNGNDVCEATIRLIYDLSIILCEACDQARTPWSSVVAAIPSLDTPWAAEAVAGFVGAERP